MLFIRLQEAVSDEAITRTLSAFVSTVNALSDLLASEPDFPADFNRQASELLRALKWHGQRLDRQNVPDDLWKDLRPAGAPDTYAEFKGGVLHGTLNKVASSLRDLIERPASKSEARVRLAQERIGSLQQAVTGMAPSGNMAAAGA